MENAKGYCEYLIVGVTVDELVSYKNKEAFVPHDERMEIIRSIKYVDEVVSQTDIDKIKAWEKYKFDVLFVGSDWKGTQSWNDYERQFSKIGVDIVYFPYTKSTSSTQLREVLLHHIKEIE